MFAISNNDSVLYDAIVGNDLEKCNKMPKRTAFVLQGHRAREDALSCLRLAVEETFLQSILHTFVRILRQQAFAIQILRHAC